MAGVELAVPGEAGLPDGREHLADAVDQAVVLGLDQVEQALGLSVHLPFLPMVQVDGVVDLDTRRRKEGDDDQQQQQQHQATEQTHVGEGSCGE